MDIDPDHLPCQHVVEIVTDYLEGQLSSADRTRFEEHLVICGDCSGYVHQIRKTVRLSAALATRTANPAAKQALLAAFRARNKP